MVKKVNMEDALDLKIAKKPQPVTIEDDKPESFHTFTFKIPKSEAWKFKEWCSRHQLTQVTAFRKGYELLQREFGK